MIVFETPELRNEVACYLLMGFSSAKYALLEKDWQKNLKRRIDKGFGSQVSSVTVSGVWSKVVGGCDR